MARVKVVVSAPYARPCIERYRSRLEAAGCEVVEALATERLEEDQLLEVLPGAQGIICGDDRITARVLAAAPDLRVISKWGTGIDSIDVEEARRRGIVVCNTPNAFSEPVADTVMGYVLVAGRQLDRMNVEMHQGSGASRNCGPSQNRRWASLVSATAAAPWRVAPRPSGCVSLARTS
jgi:D-3-phosphoglycerate dehydrogenase / 2-oxoglutarate reductase